VAGENEIYVSAITGDGINDLREKIAHLIKAEDEGKRLVADLISPHDIVVLVTPIDESAPKGRLILPQQQTIRDILDAGAIAVVTKDTELTATLEKLGTKPALVITDSQAFGRVSKMVPEDIPLTSFSILFARYKGDLAGAVAGATALDTLKDGDRVLISEGCTHHRQCGDIGTVKMPAWIKKHTGKEIEFDFTSGGDFPDDLSPYALVVHCGGCMLTEREMKSRIRHSLECNIPITNYGIAIAHMNGILARSIKPLKSL
jgi:[FeFe] hydrogenase H-cluster maturation GTPase HydF